MPTPKDETWEALERIAAEGSDLDRPMKMDFFVAVPDEASGLVVASRARALGFDTSVELDDETQTWTCYCAKIIVPSYTTVVAIEAQLDSLAQDVGGYADGFGTFGNANGEP